MNHKNLIASINRLSNQKQQEKLQIEQRYSELKSAFFKLSERIGDLIEVANVWENKMYDLTSVKIKRIGDGQEIVTGVMALPDQIGFVRDGENGIKYLGFYGKFLFNSSGFDFIGENKRKASLSIRSQIMEKLIDQFDAFESGFYRWVEQNTKSVQTQESYISIYNGRAIEIQAYSSEEAIKIANAVFESEGCEIVRKNQLEELDVYTKEFLIQE